MPLSQIHALVARGSTILAEHQAGSRDFSQGELQLSANPLHHHTETMQVRVWLDFLWKELHLGVGLDRAIVRFGDTGIDPVQV